MGTLPNQSFTPVESAVRLTACLHEDRTFNLVGLKLAVLSLSRHCPGMPILVSCPNQERLQPWLDTQPHVRLVSVPGLANRGWNVKPTVLLHCLALGYSDLVWIDSDIIVSADFRQRFSCYSDETLISSQESYWEQQQSSTIRTVGWGLKPGRIVPTVINSGICRVTLKHIKLLETWQALLNHPAYIQVQQQPYYDRPVHMVGDQDSLTALLGSTEFADVPLELLERGVDILQCFGASGFTPTERLRSLFSKTKPMFVHAIARRPWNRSALPSEIWQVDEPFTQRLRSYLDYLHLELCPYLDLASEYREQLGEDAAWMTLKSKPAKILRRLSLGNSALQAFPLALFEAIVRHLRRLFRIGRYSLRQPLILSLLLLKNKSNK